MMSLTSDDIDKLLDDTEFLTTVKPQIKELVSNCKFSQTVKSLLQDDTIIQKLAHTLLTVCVMAHDKKDASLDKHLFQDEIFFKSFANLVGTIMIKYALLKNPQAANMIHVDDQLEIPLYNKDEHFGDKNNG